MANRRLVQNTGALVAIKSVNLAKLNKKLKENLYLEINILRGLEHPHIVALIDCRESKSHIHLVMEFCELGDLSLFIRKRDKLGNHPATKDMAKKYPNPGAGGLNEVITRHFLKQLASALEFLRERNFIHRDLKPQNLLLNPSPQFLETAPDAPLIMGASEKSLKPITGVLSLPMLKIADFGFARSLPSTSLAETLCGSPLYMAPEILRYEKYDAKADLWSVGTVLYEMVAGRPPFRASNHVELLRKIEQSEDSIRFPKEAVVSGDMQKLIRALLKRNPVERMSFENFFGHGVIKEPIPGLVGEDRPRPPRNSVSEGGPSSTHATNSQTRSANVMREGARTEEVHHHSSSPRDRPMRTPSNQALAEAQVSGRTTFGTSPRREAIAAQASRKPSSLPKDHRPPMVAVATAPTRTQLHGEEAPLPGATEAIRRLSRDSQSPSSPSDSLRVEPTPEPKPRRRKTSVAQAPAVQDERERAAQDVAFERDYVVVEKQAVVINAMADHMQAATPRVSGTEQQPLSHRSGQMVRRATTAGTPVSASGPRPSSGAIAINQARARPDATQNRQSSYDRRYGVSPGSATSAISKAIHGASLRLFGIGYTPQLLGKGHSPPQLYSAFPTYPTPQGVSGLIEDAKASGPMDEDWQTARIIEESASRSDVVYGFAEVKYKQLIPPAPSMDHGMNPTSIEASGEDDDGLTVDATVTLSEEALVLYVKALSILAKSMDFAGAWWNRNTRTGGQAPRPDSANAASAAARINVMVQWVRARFNEVLEKAEIVRLKLIEAQKQLPEDHPGHPNNHVTASTMSRPGASAEGVVLSSGVTAEKLMYDRALEMSRTAAINEIANEDLEGCEISYLTAIRMLEAVLENDEEMVYPPNAAPKMEKDGKSDDAPVNGIDLADREAVQKGETLSLDM